MNNWKILLIYLANILSITFFLLLGLITFMLLALDKINKQSVFIQLILWIPVITICFIAYYSSLNNAKNDCKNKEG